MRSIRRLALLCAVAAGSAVLAGPAFGAFARPNAALYPFVLGTPHFLVHYQSDLLNEPEWAITQTTAGDIAARAERAYGAELADGYPAPLSDGGLGGDARIDIYVSKLPPGVLGQAEWDVDNAQTFGFIEVAGNVSDLGLDQHTIAHELFHLIQFGVWLPTNVTDYWLLEGSAEWMGYRVDRYLGSHPFEYGPSDMALDCRDRLGTNQCDLTDSYKNNGYSRWPFFEYAIEKYGSSFVKDIFGRGAAGGPAVTADDALDTAFKAKGTTLSDAYNAWTSSDLASAYSVAPLQAVKPLPYTTVQVGVAGQDWVSLSPIDANHLSTRYVKFTRGDGDSSHTCYSATLSLKVTMPAGSLSKPAFYWDGKGSSPVQLAVNGNVATADLPWDTCSYSSQAAYLSLPNASWNPIVDGADFYVSFKLDVDEKTPTTPAPPPDPVVVNTPVVPVASTDVAPTLELFGPELLKLSATQTQLRLIVSSTGQGALRGMLGSVDLGKVALRAGANDVRFALPKNVLKSLRRSASASNMLTLTPLSSDGSATGPALVRKVSVATPKKKPARHR